MTPMSDQMVEEVSQLFGALGDPSRLRILRTILESPEPLSQGAIAETAGLSQANASKHLGYLVRVGLLNREPEGNTVRFTLATPLVGEICDLVCGHVSERIRAAYRLLHPAE